MHGKSIYNVLTIEHSIGHGVFYRKKNIERNVWSWDIFPNLLIFLCSKWENKQWTQQQKIKKIYF